MFKALVRLIVRPEQREKGQRAGRAERLLIV